MTGPEIVAVIEQTLYAKGISKGEFYRACDVTAAMMSNWRRGKNLPLMDTMARINRYLGTDLILTQTLRLPSANDPRPPLRVPPLRLPTADKSEDAEIAAYLQQIKDDPSTRLMFDLAKGATMEEIKATVAFLKALREQR